MADFVEVPIQRLSEEVLAALLEEFASRDGTDYGHYELTLAGKVGRLRAQLQDGSLCLLYDGDSQEWDLLPREQAQELLE
ncbi:YheU family protein [Halieaceae bacterium IMCC14734]|uniref:YheU family protein n=1 Tax=Candidatus Litorirhabdus singularis TaxID=2518993 RepID=A0ABT3TGM0_9GAMM|nr:YheU family protein [Candidatus Litorirhabdus singularis]MCX2981463.1 YheU family protein [Candidatus Litorirhabdus singularis]